MMTGGARMAVADKSVDRVFLMETSNINGQP
jgi:hypothetical protein